MNQRNRRLVAGIVVAAAVVLLGRSGTVGAQHTGSVSDWVKIGQHRINGNNINYTIDQDRDLILCFGTPQEQISLSGAEAEAMRRWLDARSDDPMAAGKSAPPPPAPR